MKSCFITISYKGAFIHCNSISGLTEITEQFSVQMPNGKMHYPKTLLGAKRLISKLLA